MYNFVKFNSLQWIVMLSLETNSVPSEECLSGYIVLCLFKGKKFLCLYLSQEIVSALLPFELK